ncbi:MAG: hypothetical protein HFJ51_05705 [Clostridia bacterium]|nr:hypothetical protein [Clostridia bacterium]
MYVKEFRNILVATTMLVEEMRAKLGKKPKCFKTKVDFSKRTVGKLTVLLLCEIIIVKIISQMRNNLCNLTGVGLFCIIPMVEEK